MKKFLAFCLSILVMGFVTVQAQAQCLGSQSRSVTCLDWQGNVVSDAFCNDARVGARPASTQTCQIFCGGGGGDPLVFDLDGDGVNLVSAENGVSFDMDNDGIADQTGWSDGIDGILALDDNGNGSIDNQSELFGRDREHAAFADLATHDSNGDGQITASDDVWSNLTMWVDGNRDGVSDAHEMLSMDDIGMVNIDLGAIEVNETNAGNEVTRKSTFTRFIEGIGEIISTVIETFFNFFKG